MPIQHDAPSDPFDRALQSGWLPFEGFVSYFWFGESGTMKLYLTLACSSSDS